MSKTELNAHDNIGGSRSRSWWAKVECQRRQVGVGCMSPSPQIF